MTDRLERTYRRFAQGGGVTPPRLDLQLPGPGPDQGYQLGLAVGAAAGTGDQRPYAALRVKSDRVERESGPRGLRKRKWAGQPGKYLGLVLLFDPRDGRLLCVMQDGWLQRMRVGCDSALGVRLLARPDAEILAILGSGGMAESHVLAIRHERPLRQIRVFSPTPAHCADFAARMRNETGIETLACASPEEAARGADLLCSCTNSAEPVVDASLLAKGMHITAIGGGLTNEAAALVDYALRFGTATAPLGFDDWKHDEESMVYSNASARLAFGGTAQFAYFTEGVERTLVECGGQAVRRNAEQITFSQRGNIHGIQFAAAAGEVYEAALRAGAGMEWSKPADGFLQDIRN